jgi:hypothetical protein
MLRVRVLALSLVVAYPSAALAAGPPPHSASRAQYDKAQLLFEKAKKQYEGGKPKDAIDGFRKSYDVVGSPISRLFIARCLALLGQDREAFNELVEVKLDAAEEAKVEPKYAETRDAAEQERGELEARVAVVRVRATTDGGAGQLTIGGASIPARAWAEPLAVAPGSIEVVLSSSSRTDRRVVEARVGQPVEVALSTRADAPPPPVAKGPSEAELAAESRRKSLRTGAYVSAAVGAAGVVTFAVAGSLARSKYNSLHDSCGGGCDPSKQSDIDSGRRTTTIANVGLVVGAVGAVAGATLFVLSRPTTESPARTAVSVGPGWVGVDGRF